MALASLLSGALASSARAWPHEGTEVHPGVIYRRFSGAIDIPGTGVSEQEIYVAYIDTWDGRVSFVANRSDVRPLTTSSFASRTGARVAINTNFGTTAGVACGLMAGQGEIWPDNYHGVPGSRCSDSVGFTAANEVRWFDSYDFLSGPLPDGVTDVATGMPTLVRDGEIVDQAALEASDYPSHMATAQPRTGICSHEDGRTLALVVVDGRAPGRVGMRAITFARFMRHVLGCRHAVNLDGGGSSTMFIQGQPGEGTRPAGVVNRTSDGPERSVCCHLGVRIDEGGTLWSAELVDRSPASMTGRPGETFELWATFRNTGRRTWSPDGELPVRLGTDEPMDRSSALFLEETWISPSRPVAVEAVTSPGATGTFRFLARAPSMEGTHAESFAPLAEGAAWMRGTPLRWDITVASESNRGPGDASVPPDANPPVERPDGPVTGDCSCRAGGSSARGGWAVCLLLLGLFVVRRASSRR